MHFKPISTLYILKIFLTVPDICICGIHHWMIFRSNYRKLTWVGFEPTITEFCSDALTDWAIRTWVQLALRAIFVQLLQFHLFVQCLHFISAIAFFSCHICFKQSLAQVIMLAVEWLIHMVFTVFMACVGFEPTTTEFRPDVLTFRCLQVSSQASTSIHQFPWPEQ